MVSVAQFESIWKHLASCLIRQTRLKEIHEDTTETNIQHTLMMRHAYLDQQYLYNIYPLTWAYVSLPS